MKVKNRQSRIIEILLEQEAYITTAAIAAQLGLSSRTIRNELAALEPELVGLEVKLLSKAGSGVLLEAGPSAKLAIRLLLNEAMTKPLVKKGYSPKQRQQHMILRLLFSDEPLKVAVFERELHISRATAFNDLSVVEKTLTTYKLLLSRHKNAGLAVSGRERHMRTCILDMMLQEADYPQFCALLKGGEAKQKQYFPVLNLEGHFLKDYFSQLRLLNLQQRLPLSLQSAAAILLRTCISLLRYKNGREVQLSAALKEELSTAHDMGEIKKMIQPLERYFQVKLPDSEYQYLQVFFLAVDGSYFVTSKEQNYAKALVHSFLRDWSAELQLDLNKDKQIAEDVYEALLPIMARFVFGIRVENLFANDVRLQYTKYFPMVGKSLQVLEKRYGFYSSDSELGALVLSLVAALKRLSQPIRALLFCHCEPALKKFLVQALLSNFADLEIATQENFYNVQARDFSAFDLIISTTAIDLKTSIPLVVVHPLMKVKDYARLWELFYAIRAQRQ